MSRPELHASLDSPLPREVRVGRGTALFVAGTCYCPTARIKALELVVDGTGHPVTAHGMPRLDFFAELHPGLDPLATEGVTADPASSADPRLRSYRSGFWGVAPIPAGSGENVRVAVRARL